MNNLTTYIIITIIVTAIIVLLNVIKTNNKPKSLMDEFNSIPEFKKQKDIFDILQSINNGGTDQDIIPGGYGEFGYDVTNPIPVNTIFGNTSYLGRLRTLDDMKITYERIGSFSSPVSANPIDGYVIYATGEKIAKLYIDPYNKKNSKKAPRNFKLIS
jgi:hypothetical protein